MDEMTQPQVVQAANQPNISDGGEALDSASGKMGEARSEGAERPFLTVRYNKQDKPLSREEAAVYAQKGMNYDKLSERLKAADEQLNSLGSNAQTSQVSGGSRMPEAEEPGATQSMLNGQDMQAVVSAQLKAFETAHTDIDPWSLPEAVLTEWKRGVPLGEAYYAYQANELDSKVRDLERIERAKAANESNAAASMGGAGSMGAAHPQPLTDDAIQTMSPAQLDKNHARIWAYLTGQKS